MRAGDAGATLAKQWAAREARLSATAIISPRKLAIAAQGATPILPPMSLANAGRTLILVALTALIAGCGGISGSHSVSPASLLLPGLLKVTPKRSPVEPPKTSELAAVGTVSVL